MSWSVLAGVTAAALLLAATLLHPAFAWVVTAPLVLAGRRGLRSGVALGATFATTFALAAHAPWLTEAALRYFDLDPAAAVVGAVALAAGCGIVFGALLGVLLHGVHARDTLWSPLALAAAWVTWEELTRIGFPSYPWVTLAATQTDAAVVLQTASLGGHALLAFVLAAAGAAAGQCARRLATGRSPSQPLVVLVLLVVAVVGFGWVRLSNRRPAAATRCVLAAVDAHVPSRLSTAEALERHRAASAPALALAPDALVWPESALPGDPRLDREILAALRALAREHDVLLVTGAPRVAWDARWGEARHNSLLAVAADGTLASYDKRALVPIGEYWPFAWWSAPEALRVAAVEPGTRAVLFEAGGCAVGTLVCSDAERPALARELAAAGADALVVATNDAPLPPRAVATEVAQARLRAVETGLPVLRAANAGESVAIDRYGRTSEARESVVVLAVDEPRRPAAAVRWSVPFVVLCALATAITWASGLALRRP